MSTIPVDFLIKLHKLWFKLKIFLRTVWQTIMLWVGLNFPEIILKLFINTNINGYDANNIRLLWILKFYSDKHSKLKTAFDKPSINIIFHRGEIKKEYWINIYQNEYKYTYRNNNEVNITMYRFERNTVNFDKLKTE